MICELNITNILVPDWRSYSITPCLPHMQLLIIVPWMRHNSSQIYRTVTHKTEFEKDINLVSYVFNFFFQLNWIHWSKKCMEWTTLKYLSVMFTCLNYWKVNQYGELWMEQLKENWQQFALYRVFFNMRLHMIGWTTSLLHSDQWCHPLYRAKSHVKKTLCVKMSGGAQEDNPSLFLPFSPVYIWK